ncbi:MAG: hypothetical protein N3A66_02885 [Planctomycetota bacterium]|nr:hypothetical protein [Planctomycetota bacterium]
MVRVCCVCHRLQRDGEWVMAPLPVDELPTHGYCPQCAANAWREIKLMLYRDKQLASPPLSADSAVA